jgi:hypothetical protein
MSRGTPGFSGIVGIIGGIVVVGFLMTFVLGMMSHWVPLGLAILVGLWAVQSIGKH